MPDLAQLSSYEMTYLSPGINLQKLYTKEEFNKISYLTDLDIFFQEDSSYKIGVTGTNGKSTCCYQLHQLLEDSQLIGNIGAPVLDNINSCSYSIIELSSFQLEKVKDVKLDFGALLNIAPDHIDYHGTFEKYANAKKRIKESKISTEESNPKKLWSMITGRKLREVQDLALKELPHRLEHVVTHNQLVFINDSKATNVNAAWYAVESMNKSFVWILGGVDKGNDYKELVKVAKEKKIKAIVCLGLDNQKIKDSFKNVVEIIEDANNMSEAVKKSYNIASSGDAVLLSPACASFDLFENFEERGNKFKEEVRKL